MLHVCDGFFFDLLAFIRRRRSSPANASPVQPVQAQAEARDDESLQRQQDEVVFWGLHAFPVLW